MTKEIEITVKDGEKSYSCKLKRPDIATLSRVNKLSKSDEVLAVCHTEYYYLSYQYNSWICCIVLSQAFV